MQLLNSCKVVIYVTYEPLESTAILNLFQNEHHEIPSEPEYSVAAASIYVTFLKLL